MNIHGGEAALCLGGVLQVILLKALLSVPAAELKVLICIHNNPPIQIKEKKELKLQDWQKDNRKVWIYFVREANSFSYLRGFKILLELCVCVCLGVGGAQMILLGANLLFVFVRVERGGPLRLQLPCSSLSMTSPVMGF